jgi:hypothetical protein
VRTRLRQRLDLLLESIVLRHQLAVLQRTGTRRPCFRPSERLIWLLLSRWWANWQRSLIIVEPATVLRWRRRGLWAIWLSGSCRRGGRPRIGSEVRALIVRMSQENFLWGAAADPWRAAETWIRCLARYSVSLHAQARLSAHPHLARLPAGPGIWDRYDRSWRSRSAIRQASCSRPRLDRASCPVRHQGGDGFRCGLIEPSLTLHRLRPYRSSNRTARRDPRIDCMPIPRPPTTLDRGDNWTMAGRRLSPYRSRASPTSKLRAFTNFARPTAIARASGPRLSARGRPIALGGACSRIALPCGLALRRRPCDLSVPPRLGGPRT